MVKEKDKRKEKVKKGYMGKLGSKITTATVPRQRRQKYLLVFLNVHRIIRKRTEDTIVALHPESIQGIEISQGTEV